MSHELECPKDFLTDLPACCLDGTRPCLCNQVDVQSRCPEQMSGADVRGRCPIDRCVHEADVLIPDGQLNQAGGEDDPVQL